MAQFIGELYIAVVGIALPATASTNKKSITIKEDLRTTQKNST